MARFIKVYDENGKYAINSEDCPMKLGSGSMLVYDRDGNITICEKPYMNLFANEKDIIKCDLKTGKLTTFSHDYLFINDPKYGIIRESSYGSMEKCFSSWNEEDESEPCGYGTATDLLTLDNQILIDFLKKILEYVDKAIPNPDYLYSQKERLNIAFQDCFGQYHGNINYEKLNELTKEELVYFILQCDNYSVTDYSSSFYDLKVHGILRHKYLRPCGCHKFCECDHEKL